MQTTSSALRDGGWVKGDVQRMLCMLDANQADKAALLLHRTQQNTTLAAHRSGSMCITSHRRDNLYAIENRWFGYRPVLPNLRCQQCSTYTRVQSCRSPF